MPAIKEKFEMSETIRGEVKPDVVEALSSEIMEKLSHKDGPSAHEILDACVEVSGFVLGALMCPCCRTSLHKQFKSKLRRVIDDSAKFAEQNNSLPKH